MVTRCRAVIVGFFFWGVIANQVCFGSLSISGPIKVCADRLEELQTKQGASAGSWPGESYFTGSIVVGMVGAYEAEGDGSYRTCAELGGDYILYSAQGNFYGDEAFALSRLSQISNDSSYNIWRTALIDFYFNVEHDVDGIEGYISQFVGAEPSTAVFYIANHVVAAYYVHAEDKQIWRQALIDYLAQVDDSCDFPVMGLGVATWALATTGPLDNTLIDPSGAGAAYWNGKKLADLPDLLLSHQVPKGEGYAGSFYWQFDHSSGEAASGYTEDAIFGSLGLMAASQAGEDSILAVREALLRGVGRTGTVWEHLSQQGAIYSAYAGEMLHVLSEIGIPGWAPVGPFIYDLDDDDFIGPGDLSLFACCWLHLASDSGCFGLLPCIDCDFDCDGFVGPGDLSWFATGWLKRCDDPAVLWPPYQGGMQTSGFTAQALGSFTPDVKVRLVTLMSPSSSDTTETLPSSVSSVSQGQDYYVEVWASDVGGTNTGLTSVYADMIFAPSDAASVRSINHGGIFTVFPSGTVGTGRIDELGGFSLTAAGVEPQWARVATIRMHAEATGPITFSLAESSTGIAALGRGLVPWPDVGLGGAGTPPFCGDPDHPYPIGDLNHDCYVGWLDMGVFAAYWLQTGCADFEDCSGADLDLSGCVDFDDFCFLAAHWLECTLPVCD